MSMYILGECLEEENECALISDTETLSEDKTDKCIKNKFVRMSMWEWVSENEWGWVKGRERINVFKKEMRDSKTVN